MRSRPGVPVLQTFACNRDDVAAWDEVHVSARRGRVAAAIGLRVPLSFTFSGQRSHDGMPRRALVLEGPGSRYASQPAIRLRPVRKKPVYRLRGFNKLLANA